MAAHGAGHHIQETFDLSQGEEAFAAAAVTDGARGCAVYWDGRMHRFPAPHINETDPTGAGDIFAALIFLRFHETRDAFEAARPATFLASRSVMREGPAGGPTREEIRQGKLVAEEP
jgi:sugar/nucleoside kinase (ribokinase family)